MTPASNRIPAPPEGKALGRHAESAAMLLRALANPHRLQVLCVLVEGERSVGALNARIALSQSALSQHLAILRADRLVRTRRDAQTIYYRVAPGPARQILRVLYRHFCGPAGTRRRR